MHSRASYLCLLLLLAPCCHAAVNTNATADSNGHAEALLGANVETAASVNLPKGFNPQPPPPKPLLYPLVTASPTSIVISPGWKPFFQPAASSSTQRNSLHTPLLRPDTADAQLVDGPPMEAVVYGTWKPDRPLKPHAIFEPTQSAGDSGESAAGSYEFDSLGPALMGQLDPHRIPYIPNASGYTELSNERRYEIDIKNQAYNKTGRQKITKPPSQRETFDGYSSSKGALEVINLNMSDPALLAVAQQINDSIEQTTTSLRAENAAAKQSTWVPFVPTDATGDTDHTTPTAKMWPKDFMTSNEHMAPLKEDSSERSEPSLEHTMLPEIPANITKMGVPYEDQSSSGDDPTICVPLTVREKIITNAEAQLVDVERIYCFPLPATDVEMEVSSNATKATSSATSSTASTLGIDAKVNNWSDYEKTTATSNGASVLLSKKSSTLIAVCSVMARLHIMLLKG